ncbi:hypothetical protein KTI59_03850 [Acinetobacter radioresistens]|uniref:hypothetical protein n=1 Tax=Acinetobacter radioresistens TaxID=40216 RepID=UPI0021CDDB1E|nr:hypothetical protein [Acinetobacter radioresistens]MCU4499258.1 hypothetical protein [Acinetobacter radioresistens]
MRDKTYRLATDANGDIGLSIENIESWGNHYLSILEVLKDESVNFQGKGEVMRLLYKTGMHMLEDPKKYLKKKPVGRPNKSTPEVVKKTMCIMYKLGLATTLVEAKERTAKHLKMTFDAVDKAARGFTLEKLQGGTN